MKHLFLLLLLPLLCACGPNTGYPQIGDVLCSNGKAYAVTDGTGTTLWTKRIKEADSLCSNVVKN